MITPRPPGASEEPLAPEESGWTPGLDLIRFRWGALHLAVPARQVLGLEQDCDPNAPVVGDLLGLPNPTPEGIGARIRRLGLRGPAPGAGLRVQEPVTRIHLEANAIHPLPPLIAARLRLPQVRALAMPRDPTDGAILIILDFMAPRTCLDGSLQGHPVPSYPLQA